MKAFSVPTSQQLARLAPWFGLGLVGVAAMLTIGRQSFDVAAARSDMNTLEQRLAEGRNLRDRLKSEVDLATTPILQASPQRSLAAALRQRIEQSGLGFVQIVQLQLLERRKAERFELNSFNLTVQLPARELERWLYNLERMPPVLLLDRVEVRLATPPTAPVEARTLQVTVNGQAIVDDQNAKS